MPVTAAVYSRKRRATWLVGALLLAGCTTHGRVGALPQVADPGAAVEIIVIREWRFVGGAANVAVSLDGVPLYGLSTNEHAVLRAPAGYHVVGISTKGIGTYESSASVQAVAQQRYYFRKETTFFDGPQLQPIGAEAGQALMAKTTRIAP
jgi:hypothetical protein